MKQLLTEKLNNVNIYVKWLCHIFVHFKKCNRLGDVGAFQLVTCHLHNSS
jgi:hypothetical protein